MIKMTSTYHSDTVIQEGFAEDEKIKIGIDTNFRKYGQHCYRINCNDQYKDDDNDDVDDNDDDNDNDDDDDEK